MNFGGIGQTCKTKLVPRRRTVDGSTFHLLLLLDAPWFGSCGAFLEKQDLKDRG